MSSSQHQPNSSDSAIPQNSFYRFVLTIIIIVPIVYLSVFLSAIVLEWLDSHDRKMCLGIPIFVGTGGVSIVVLMATWKDMTRLAVDLKQFVFNKASLPPYYEFIELFAQLFLILIAIGSFKESEFPNIREPGEPSFAWQHRHLAIPEENVRYLAQYPIVFENATVQNDELNAGVEILPAHKNQINPLLQALVPCASKNDKVILDIIGYSSTRKFDDVPVERSNELNKETANLRGQNLHTYVQGFLEERDALEKFDLSPSYIWPSYEALERPIYDFEGTIPDTAQELLNRSAFINLVDAGACTVFKG